MNENDRGKFRKTRKSEKCWLTSFTDEKQKSILHAKGVGSLKINTTYDNGASKIRVVDLFGSIHLRPFFLYTCINVNPHVV